MKIGILTLHSNTNFGGGLQQIAMFETLRELGHDPQFLCVENDNAALPASKRILGILTSYSPRQIIGAVSEAYRRIFSKKVACIPNNELYIKTDNFNYNSLNYTPKFKTDCLKDYAAGCDALIFGSDQIWTNVYSDTLPFFGDGLNEYKGKKIAYAACSVHKRVPTYNRTKLGNLLSDFDVISVRDVTTQQLVERYAKFTPSIVCDPTLLYDFNKYLKPSAIYGDYIFAYVLGDKSAEWHQNNINKIKAETGLDKVVVLTTSLDEQYPWADIVITDAIAIDWLNILHGAKFVYTNSFHAVLFSLKFHKQFVAYYGDLVRSSRMLCLRSQFMINSRIVIHPCRVDVSKPMHFDETDSIIKKSAATSLTFLKESLS